MEISDQASGMFVFNFEFGRADAKAAQTDDADVWRPLEANASCAIKRRESLSISI